MDGKKIGIVEDWEMMDDFYQDGEMKEMSIEDFMEDGDAGNGCVAGGTQIEELGKMEVVVRRVLELSQSGRNSEQIAGEMGRERKFVDEVLICAQSFPEDDALAIARLIVFG